MKAIAEMLKPRESVFSDSTREDVLNLSDFADRRIDADKFFSENFKTQGMSMLFDTAFKRFKSICYYRGKEKQEISLEALRNEVAQFLQIDNLSFLLGAGLCSSSKNVSKRASKM